MNRRQFQEAIVLSVMSSFGCSHGSISKPELIGKTFQKIAFPYSIWLWGSLLPELDFVEGIAIGRNKRLGEFDPHGLAQILSAPIDYSHYDYVKKVLQMLYLVDMQVKSGCLADDQSDTLSHVSKIISLKKYGNYCLRYSSSGPNLAQRINSLDLLGIRNPKLSDPLTRGEVNPMIQREVVLTERVFELISGLKLKTIFFNYASCELSPLLNWMAERNTHIKDIECMGLPSGLSNGDYRMILERVAPPILDLSGYEGNLMSLSNYICLAGEAGVKWIIIYDYVGFDWDFLVTKMKSNLSETSSIIGVMGYNRLVVRA